MTSGSRYGHEPACSLLLVSGLQSGSTATLAVAHRPITLELSTLDGAVIGLELASVVLDDASYKIVLTFCA